jgi:FtsP/CotA-like multicopper oxidase with cupredoxin domain
VAPATLVFHDVMGLNLAIRWCPAGSEESLHPAHIHEVHRELVELQNVRLDRAYYHWKVLLNWPKGGEVSFGAAGFTQALRAEPILTTKQHLTLRQRRPAKGRPDEAGPKAEPG